MLNEYAFNKKAENTGTKTTGVEKHKIYLEILTVIVKSNSV